MKVAEMLGFEFEIFDKEEIGGEFSNEFWQNRVDIESSDLWGNVNYLINQYRAYGQNRQHLNNENGFPKVQFFWQMFPFNLLCAEFLVPLNCLTLICNPFAILMWLIYIPFMLFVVAPWNVFWTALLLPLFIFCSPCLYSGLCIYYIVTPF